MNKQCVTCRFVALDEKGLPKCILEHSLSRKKYCIDEQKAKDEEYILKGRRQCARCGELYQVSEFYRNARYSDGLDCYCKYCRKELNMYYQSKREALLECQ